MWWCLTILGLLAAGVCFVGVGVCLLRYNRVWIKRFIIGFIISFAFAFISVGMAGAGAGS
ncbi:MAG: hypothetical protein QHH02_00710 [Syntrophomonadaceae bacterium]|nr:hypothetical protein [Syntrophomonadaceae bacterium]